MDIEPTLHAHIIGFPYHANSKSNNVDGKHDIEDVPDSSIYGPLYQISNNYLENGYGVLYVAQSLPNERDKAKVIENIRNANNNNNNTDDVQNNISKGLLHVINSDSIYKDNAGGRDIVNFLLSNVSQIQRKSQQGKTKAVIFNAPDQYFGRGKYAVFRDFEREIDKALPSDVSLLCWYKKGWLNKLSLSHAISLLADHKYTIHNDLRYKQWDTNRIIDVISKGIDNNLGEGSSILLFQTLKSAHKLKQDSIFRKPDLFEESLKRALGKDNANSVINSIFEEIIKEVEFGLTGNNEPKSKKR